VKPRNEHTHTHTHTYRLTLNEIATDTLISGVSMEKNKSKGFVKVVHIVIPLCA